ncbi:hypothetical protein [Leeuwenhoekiella sp. ZYFB001]|uniref:hypothetical protein n=1 Tax=Leeuwenhoekiella sp. ZYFB001 TaxID=2719912 RepID=UPI00143182CC|nr:hypothetical protein [Leeuwenhoekiella sp. ZYFB001]
MIYNKSLDLKFFTKQEIDQQFKRIDKEINGSMSFETIIKKFSDITHNSVYPCITLEPNSPKINIYRITKTWSTFDENNPNDFSYNKDGANGRAHLEGYPVLYGASDPFTAFQEMKGCIRTKEIFYLSIWELNVEKNTPILAIINPKTYSITNQLSFIQEKLKTMFFSLSENLPQEYQNSLMYSIEKMGSLYGTKGNFKYHITSAYSHNILYASDDVNIPIIVFPSVESNLNGLNWAIHPSIIENNDIKLVETYKLRLEEDNTKKHLSKLYLSAIRKGIVNKSSIQWYGLLSSDYQVLYKNIKVKIQKNMVIDGGLILDKKIIDSSLSLKNIIDKSLNPEKIQERIDSSRININQDMFLNSLSNRVIKYIIIKLDPNLKILSANGIIIIKEINVPICFNVGFHFKIKD